MDNSKDNLNEALADAVMNRPREFFYAKIGFGFLKFRKRFCLWSPTLGMSLMLERHISALGLNNDLLSKNPPMEAMRIIPIKRKEICSILAILSLRRFKDLSKSRIIRRRARYFSKKLSDQELAQLILIALSEPKAESFISRSGLDKEHEEQSRIVKHKNKDGHTLSFGGRTIYGSLIDAACAKYGWTKEYVVWGIDLCSLRMMLADSVNTVYLSDEEIKDLHIVAGGVIDANDPASIAQLAAMNLS